MPDEVANGNFIADLADPAKTGAADSQAPHATAVPVPPVTVDLTNLAATDGSAASQAPHATGITVPLLEAVMTDLRASGGTVWAQEVAAYASSEAPTVEMSPKLPSGSATREVLGRTRELFCRLTAPFSAIIDFVIRITEASETRVYENGNTKISD